MDTKSLARFQYYTDNSKGPDACWPWVGKRLVGGYGRFWYDGDQRYAHRIAYEISYGPIPQGMKVLHQCDNPPCVNPAHLRVGTHAENMAEKVARNRQGKGDDVASPGWANPRAKLTELDVLEIRRVYAVGGGDVVQSLVDLFGVTRQIIWRVATGRSWSYLDSNQVPRTREEKLRGRFFAKVNKVEDQDSCWEWTASRFGTGYGSFGIGTKVKYAHRVSWELENGPIPNGLWVLHRCDNPRCIRPSHLFLGTAAENNADMRAKGRVNSNPWVARGDENGMRKHPERVLRGDDHWMRKHPELIPRGEDHWTQKHPELVRRGDSHYHSKITESQGKEIIDLYDAGGVLQKELAEMFGVKMSTINKVLTGKNWAILGGSKRYKPRGT